MILTFVAKEAEQVEYQLFTASKSDRIIRKRNRAQNRMPVIYLLGGMLFLIIDSKPTAIFLMLAAVLWYFIYPIWERGHYRRHYSAFVKDTFKDVPKTPVVVEFSEEYITTKYKEGESRVSTNEIKEINELPQSIAIKVAATQSYILPKKQIEELPALIEYLKELAAKLGVKYNDERGWTWK